MMRITESQLRRMIRGIIVEDLQSFVDAAEREKINYSADSLNDPLFMWKQNVPLRKQARRLKDLWRQHSDQKSFENITFVHWIQLPVENLAKIYNASRKDEISVSMSPANGKIIDARWGAIGLVVKGRVTFAGNNMDHIMTGYMDKAKPKDKQKYGDAGLPKRPTVARPGAFKSYVLQADDLEVHNAWKSEAILDHWTPVAWVVHEDFKRVFIPDRRSERAAQMEMLDVIKDSGLPIIDLSRRPVDIRVFEDML